MRTRHVGKATIELLLLVVLMLATGLATATAQTSIKVPDAMPEDTCVTCSDGPTGGCTSIMVGREATTDGSVITAHTCDGNYRTWLDIVPSEEHSAGATRPVYWGKLHNETPWDMRGLRLKGEIPQADSTFAFFNVAYPAMNEKGLSIGETTIGGRDELRNPEGLFLIENLQAIALERTTNARDAISLIGELVAEYGYGDWGECLTFADAAEVWHFEIQGAGPFEIGAVWAAVRIPDDHVGVSANIPRISTLDLDNPDYYMASENVHSLAEEMGWWDPNSGEEFKFWKAYSGRTPFSIREFFILSNMAPSLNLLRGQDELPFSVKPDEQVSVREVMRYYRETYEGTEYDMTKNLMVQPQRGRGEPAPDEEVGLVKSPMVNNWSIGGEMANLLNTLKPGTVEPQRAIAIARCSYSQIIQNRGWLPPEIGTLAWFSFDNPGQSPRMPIFAGTLSLPNSFQVCGQHRYREDSAVWWFRRTNRLAMIKWGDVRDIIEGASMEFEDRAFAELPSIENIAMEYYNNGRYDQFRQYITKYSNDFAHATMTKWWELGNDLWTRYARGF